MPIQEKSLRPKKFPTPETRQLFWQELCKHISEGYSMRSFYNADEDTIYSYAKDFPDDCPMHELHEAQRKSLHFWEKIGVAGATGKLDGFNATSWIFNMKNRAGWADKMEQTHKGDPNAPLLISLPDEDKEIIKRYQQSLLGEVK